MQKKNFWWQNSKMRITAYLLLILGFEGYCWILGMQLLNKEVTWILLNPLLKICGPNKEKFWRKSSAPLKDHKYVGGPLKDHKNVSGPLKDHKNVGGPQMDHKNVGGPLMDHKW